jgi:two-component system cell cycle sensor histidine kinase/response regulator CckA
MQHIFEPFYTTKEAGKGTGLGLATVFGIVKQHRGIITVESEVGRGTAFSIFVPVVELKIRTQSDAAKKADLLRGRETILLVEDESPVRELTRTVLERAGYRVLEAASGVEAELLWKQRREPIHLLLTDMVMPEGLSGWELAERLQKHEPNLKVIFASGHSAEQATRKLVLDNGRSFLQKPFSSNELIESVRRCLDRAIDHVPVSHSL